MVGALVLGGDGTALANDRIDLAQRSQPNRIITLRIAADEEFRAKGIWRRNLNAWITAVNRSFESAFSISWQVADIVNWHSDDQIRDVRAMIASLRHTVGTGPAEVLLGLSGQAVGSAGAGMPFRDVAVAVRHSVSGYDMPVVIAHELGHLFGAWHVADPRSVMFAAGARTLRFDAITHDLIQLMRDFDFGTGVLGIDGPTAFRISRIFARGHMAGAVNPLASAWATEGRDALLRRDTHRALTSFWRAARHAPTWGANRALFSRALFAAGDYRHAKAQWTAAVLQGIHPDPQFAAALETKISSLGPEPMMRCRLYRPDCRGE